MDGTVLYIQVETGMVFFTDLLFAKARHLGPLGS